MILILKFREIEVNGYTFPNINTEALLEILPYLTYLCIFSYQVTPEGNLILINDDYLIEVAKINNVIPIMVITNIGLSGRFDSDLAKTILTNEELQNKLIDNVMEIVQEKGYMGLNIDFEYVYPENKELFINFINKVYERLKIIIIYFLYHLHLKYEVINQAYFMKPMTIKLLVT